LKNIGGLKVRNRLKMWNMKVVMKELILAIISTLAFSQAVGAIPILNPNNGHYYEVVESGGLKLTNNPTTPLIQDCQGTWQH